MSSVFLLVKEISHDLRRAKTGGDLSQALGRALQLLESKDNSVEFFSKHFSTFCRRDLCSDRVLELLSEVDASAGEQTHARFFLEGPPCESLLLLCELFRKCSGSYAILYFLSLIEKFIGRDHLVRLISEHSLNKDEVAIDRGVCVPEAGVMVVLDHTLAQLASLPEVVANKLGGHHDRRFFFQENFFTCVGRAVLKALCLVHGRLSAGNDCSLKMICSLASKICLRGNTEFFFSGFLPELCVLMTEDFLWRRIGLRLVSGIDDRPMEPVLDFLVRNLEPCLSGEGPLHWMVADTIVQKRRVSFLLTSKFLFSRNLNSVAALHNIFSLLQRAKNSAALTEEVFSKLLDVWCDGNSAQASSYEQHVQLSHALLLCSSILTTASQKKVKDVALAMLLEGVQAHLSSPLQKTRQIGMVVAELLTAKLQIPGQKLKFEYEENNVSQVLQQLSLPVAEQAKQFQYRPKENFFQPLSGLFETKPHPEKDNDETSMSPSTSLPSKSKPTSTSANAAPASAPKVVELDSDDDSDLEAYDMSDGDLAEKRRDVGEGKPPVFLRDCIAGLQAREKPLRTTTCLATAEMLVRRNTPELIEVGSELLKILLHLENEYCLDDFQVHRFRAMVATTVFLPLQAAKYLTTEFYAVNYNLRQRMDMLEVLDTAAQELSSPGKALSEGQGRLVSEARPADIPIPSGIAATLTPSSSASRHANGPVAMAISGRREAEKEADWRAVVEKRVAQKTRRFAHATAQPPTAVASRFSELAGHFFFPLLARFDSGLSTLNMLGSDFLILGRLIFTLGSVLRCALHSPASRTMAGALLEFSWCLRQHKEPFVRQAVLFAYCMILSSVDGRFLVQDRAAELADCRAWILGVMTTDSDEECRRLACYAVPMLEKMLAVA